MSIKDSILESTIGYRLWMAPFAEAKFAPIAAHNNLSDVRRVLDVGCGPGTNTHHFENTSYLGLDINPRYIEDARRRYHKDFLAVDVTKYTADDGERSDFIVLNSFLHHIPDNEVERILAHLSTLLTDDGHVHIIDLVLPEKRSISRQIALWDRGDYPRPLSEWRRLFGQHFETVVLEPFPLQFLGLTLWNLVYFKGSARRDSAATGVPQTSTIQVPS
jgi:SAM-dependent methyltransferase